MVTVSTLSGCAFGSGSGSGDGATGMVAGSFECRSADGGVGFVGSGTRTDRSCAFCTLRSGLGTNWRSEKDGNTTAFTVAAAMKRTNNMARVIA